MKKFIAMWGVLLMFLTTAPMVSAKPVAVVESPVYVFKAVPEGVHVDHVFIVKNNGDEDLSIDNVMPP